MSDEKQEGKNEIKILPANLALLRREFSEKTGYLLDEITKEQLTEYKKILDDESIIENSQLDNYNEEKKNQNRVYRDKSKLIYGGVFLLLILIAFNIMRESIAKNYKSEISPISVSLHLDSAAISQDSLNQVVSKLKTIGERINDRFEVYDKKYEAFNQSIGTDISTLEMMLSIMTIFLGLFAFIGINSFRENRKEMEEEIAKSEKKLEKFQQKMERYEKLHDAYSDFLVQIRNDRMELDRDLQRNEKRIKDCKDKISEETASLINPIQLRGELDYLYNYELFGKEQKDLNDEQKFYKGLYHIMNGNNEAAINELEDISEKKSSYKFYHAIAVDDSGDYLEAIELYVKLIENSSFNEQKGIIHSNLGFTYIELAKLGTEFIVNTKYPDHDSYGKLALEMFNQRLKESSDDIIAIYGATIATYLIGNSITSDNSYLKDSKNLDYIKNTSKYEHFYSKKQLERTFEKINEIHAKFERTK